MGYTKTAILMAAMTALFVGIGYLLGGSGGIVVAFVIALGMNAFTWWNSDKMVLRMHNAQPVAPNDRAGLHAMVADLAQNANLPMPAVYLIDTAQPNAFATGRNPKNAAVAVTTGILQMLTTDELEGVLAHELAHVANRDILISSIAAMMAASLSLFARISLFTGGGGRDRNNPIGAIASILAIILAPIGAMLIRAAISRTREFQADESGAEITGRPLQLASALEKISIGTARIPMVVNPATSQLFIDNPLKALRGSGITNLFSTHPPAEQRIERLTRMASGIR